MCFIGVSGTIPPFLHGTCPCAGSRRLLIPEDERGAASGRNLRAAGEHTRWDARVQAPERIQQEICGSILFR
ncbi:hypothetical protein D3093_26445 (plasmid) [Azospirillum argentinense]|uniref:Uncharacterized protein n=1 Tax=Azospirillum argentinense TaxID=2970906 RepID=A0A4D8PL02_9PROT|nr:hypothetical protein D3093_26445 [Azospirillum argentinense]